MWSDVQKAACVEAYILTKSYDETRRLFLKKFNLNHRKLNLAPPKSCVKKWVEKFRKEGSFSKRQGGKRRSVRTEDAIRKVEDSVAHSPKRSVRRRSQCLGLKRSSLHNILKKDLHLHPYRLQVHQTLTPPDLEKRVKMAKWLEQHPPVFDKLWFSDEAHFWLSGHVNSRNAVHWGSSLPDEVLSKPLHSQKVTVWMAMRRGGGTIGPFFFEDEEGEAVTINQERYVSAALEPFWEELGRRRGIHRHEEWLQQDGATPHTAKKSLEWLHHHFRNRLISLKTAVPWSPHSPDLSPLDFFLWGFLKDRVYTEKPETTRQLKDAIITEVSHIPSEMVDNAVTHLQTVRLPAVIRRKGAHVEHLL